MILFLDSPIKTNPAKPKSPPSFAEVLLMRYNRESLIELMDEELSILDPKLKYSVHKLLSNSNSSHLLVDTLTREEISPSNDLNLLKKSSTISTFECSNHIGKFLGKSLSWEPSSQKEAGVGWNHVEKGEKALKTFRSCLNKLTVENFDAILAEVKIMRVNDDETILSFIKLLYEKAILEPTYANHYVQLTMALKNIFTIGPGKKTFDYFAIMACQQGFEDAMEKLINIKQLSDDDKDKLRRDLSGSIQFIAKMYLNRILNTRIVMEICHELLKLECTESVEPLCKLLEIAGAEIEGALPFNEKLDGIMKKLASIAKNFPTRIKFMIQNLIDQRDDGWKPRFKKEPPKKMEQVAHECGFVKRTGTVGRYDEVEQKIEIDSRPFTRNDDFNRGDYFGNRGSYGGNRGRPFRSHRRNGKPFRN